jgi:hypothetical protein
MALDGRASGRKFRVPVAERLADGFERLGPAHPLARAGLCGDGEERLLPVLTRAVSVAVGNVGGDQSLAAARDCSAPVPMSVWLDGWSETRGSR